MSAPGDDILGVERDRGVATITLNRPDRLNAWTTALELRYAAALRELARDPDVRAVVVTGAGRGYSAGWDLEELRDVSGSGERADDSTESIAVGTTLAFPKPLVAAINGSCAGLGLAQALACDLRFARAGAKLTTSYAKIGLIAEDGTSWLLPRIVGHARALDLLLSSRIVLAEEALELGLVHRVVPEDELLDAAQGYARELAASCSPAAMRTIKRMLRDHATVDAETALRESRTMALATLTQHDFREGVAAFGEKRPPRFEGLAADLDGEGAT
jgi:enoyl-CoA hydratase/carnithine racemase